VSETGLTLALPTGRIFDVTAALLGDSGIDVASSVRGGRKLQFESGGFTVVLAKDRDVPTYVEHGVADLGIAGLDVLREVGPDVYEPLDLRVGRCRMVVARPGAKPPGFYRNLHVVRVATKYPNVATRHFHGQGIPVQVIPLSGSVELAPVLGLADCIVDLVETGRTLAANDLEEDEVLFESTARIVVNRASYRLKTAPIRDLLARLSGREAR
jgi:ATP phosphoribosyltransferase